MEMYEAHIPVSDLEKSKAFYQEVVGLELAFELPHRSVAFLWVGGPKKGMLGIWGPDSDYGWQRKQRYKSHFAISLPLNELFATIARLQGMGIETRGFGGELSDEPSVIGWMPSAQIYFSDPDGHALEFITVLDDRPDPEFIGRWSEWQAR